MGMVDSLLDFLFGKSPDIFDNSGNVSHKLPKRMWDAWNNRIKMDPNYNWRNHTGTRAGTHLDAKTKPVNTIASSTDSKP